MKTFFKIMLSLVFSLTLLLSGLPLYSDTLESEEVLQETKVDVTIPNQIKKETVSTEGLSDSYEEQTWNTRLEEMFANGDIVDFEGSGTTADPYEISTAEQLALLSYLSNYRGVYPYPNIPGEMDQSLRNENLPEEYTQLEYLESISDQYINTKVTECSRFSGKILIPEDVGGSLLGYSHNQSLNLTFTNKKIALTYMDASTTTTYISYDSVVGSAVNFEFNYNNGSYTFAEETGTLPVITNKKAHPTIYLFARNHWNAYASSMSKNLRVYELKMYNFNDELVRDYIPCYRTEDGTRGLYDLVNDVFYANIGTGDFNAQKLLVTNGKTFELTNNIYLNDGVLRLNETIDESGTTSYSVNYKDGGDGILYKWTPIKSYLNFYGNGYEINGMYINNQANGSGLFGSASDWRIWNFKDIHIKNSLNYNPDNNQVSGFMGSTNAIQFTNCTFDGALVGKNYVASICSYFNWNPNGSKVAKNCKNYGKIIALEDQAGGIVTSSNTTNCSVNGCENYGDVISKKRAGGIACTLTPVSNSINYASVKSTVDTAFGVGGGSCSNSINYGNVSGKELAFGLTNGNATNCQNYGELYSGSTAYGIGNGTIKNCINYAKVVSTGAAARGIGSGTITNCVNYANLSGVYAYGIGTGTIRDSINKGDLRATSQAGGIAGDKTSIYNCQNYGAVVSTTDAGGLFAHVSAGGMKAQNCQNYGDVTASSAGGIVSAITWGNIDAYNCTNQGDISGNNAGGFVGYVNYGGNKFNKCSNTGKVKGTTYAGGLVGYFRGGQIYIDCSSNSGDVEGATATGMIANKNTSTCLLRNVSNTGNITSETRETGITLGNSFGLKDYSQAENIISVSKVNGELVKVCSNIEDGYFNYDYRTGKISSKNTNATAMFRGKVTKEYIKFNNFTDLSPPTIDGYTVLQWIQSDGTQYIDTGFIPNQDTRVDIKLELTQLTSGKNDMLFGSYISTQQRFYLAAGSGANKNVYFAYATTTSNTYLIPTLGKTYEISINKNMLYVDDVLKYTQQYSTFDCEIPFTLFGLNRGDGNIEKAHYKLYACKLYDNGKLVRDFVPGKNSDGGIGLYDRVENKFYGNSGSGSFVAGPVA